jgi:hypothetical protein
MADHDGLPVPPCATAGDAPNAARQARAARRQRSVLKGVLLMTVARVATDKRTRAAVAVAAVGVAAAAQLASEGGNPLDWYLSLSGDKRGSTP